MDTGLLSNSLGLYGLPSLSYPDFLALLRQAAFAITDSGGVQKESTVLGVPCLTLRENTDHGLCRYQRPAGP